MTDTEHLRLDPGLVAALRGGVSHAIEHGAEFVAPPHLLLALLRDPEIGAVLAPLIPRERVERAIEQAENKLPDVAEVADADDAPAPFVRYDTLAIRSLDGARSMYLDADAFHLFIEGARRAAGTYRCKHLVLGFTAEAVKHRDVLGMFGADPAQVASAVYEQ